MSEEQSLLLKYVCSPSSSIKYTSASTEDEEYTSFSFYIQNNVDFNIVGTNSTILKSMTLLGTICTVITWNRHWP